MKAIHVTKSKYLNSIRKLGILRSKPLLEHHDDLLRREFDDYDPEIGTIYAWAEHLDNERFLYDFAYWDTWGKPRNHAITGLSYEQYNDVMDMGTKAFDFIDKRGYTSELYIALLVKIPDHPLHGQFLHQQDHGMNPQWSNMDTRYEHNDKPMVFRNKVIPVCDIIKVIATANTEIKRNHRIDVNTNMVIRKFM